MPLPLETIALTDGTCRYTPQLFDAADCDRILEMLLRETAWKQEHIRMFGRQLPMPRLTAWYGEAGKTYKYSGLLNEPLPWFPEVALLRDAVSHSVGTPFNSVLCNLYRDGTDSMSWHTDDERELGRNPTIASISFGAERNFLLKHVRTGARAAFALGHGSLLIMEGPLQHHWVHRVPKTSRTVGVRVNLTFRWIV